MFFNEYLNILNNKDFLFNVKENKKFKKDRCKLNTLNYLLNLCLNIYQYDFGDNPFNFDERVIEYSFLFYSRCCCLKSKKFLNYFMLPCYPSDELNFNGRPSKVFCNSLNGKLNEEVTVIYSNEMITPELFGVGIVGDDNKANYRYINYIIEYADKISDQLNALNVLVKRLKNPYTIKTDKRNVKNIKQMNNALDENDDILVFYEDFAATTATDFLPNNFNPNLVDAMKDSINFNFNKFLEIIGINSNPNQDKKERLLVDEIGANNELTNYNAITRLKMREEFCEKIKKCFGIDITVKLNEEFIKEINNLDFVGDVNESFEKENENEKTD